MGYLSRASGHIKLSRPLNYREIKSFPEDPDAILKLHTWDNEIETDEGLLKMTQGDLIEVVYTDLFKANRIHESLAAMILALPKDVKANGMIRIEGEQNGDVHRFVVEDSKLRHEAAVLTWPDGTVEQVNDTTLVV